MRTWQLVGLLMGVVGGGCASGAIVTGGSGGAATGGAASGGSPGSGGAVSGGVGTGGVATAGAAGCPSGTECDLNPPPYIDVNICSQIVDDGATEHLVECIACCQNGGFAEASFIYSNQCTCGNLPNVSDTVTCASQFASTSVCGDCCQSLGYGRWSWSSTLCTCVGQPADIQTCAATVDMPEPSQACYNCCLNHGYLGATYFDLAPSCTCSS
jgi:hypothetical protein